MDLFSVGISSHQEVAGSSAPKYIYGIVSWQNYSVDKPYLFALSKQIETM